MSRVIDQSEEIRGLYIPIEGTGLLLPNAAVAEVISYKEPQAIPGQPEWFLGEIEWRHITIPVISFEGMMGRPVERVGEQARIAVFNTLNGSSILPFIGVVTQSIPGLVRIKSDSITEQSDEGDVSPLILYSVMLNGKEGLIPDLDHLEEMVAGVDR